MGEVTGRSLEIGGMRRVVGHHNDGKPFLGHALAHGLPAAVTFGKGKLRIKLNF